jgi:hypothetical protein
MTYRLKMWENLSPRGGVSKTTALKQRELMI